MLSPNFSIWFFASAANFGIFLDLNEGPDFCIISNLAAIEVDELGELHVAPHLDIQRNTAIAAGLQHIIIRFAA